MYNGLLKKCLIALTVFAAVFLFFAPSWGADWEVSPHVVIVEEYNDNILFSSKEDEIDDFVTYVRPRIEAKYSTDRFRMSLNSGMESEIYVDSDELNSIDHDHKLVLSYELLRTLGLRAGGYFREDTTLETELIEEGLLVNREDRRKLGGSLGFNYVFSTSLSCSADWTRRYTEYPDNPDDLNDRVSDTLKLAPRYTLSPQTSLFLNLTYTNTEYDNEGDSSIANYNISPSFRYDFAKDFYVSGEVGYRYTEYSAGSADKHSDSSVFNLTFHRDWKKVSMELLASRNQYSDVDGRSVERDRLTLRGTYRLSARLSSSLAATLRSNSVDDGSDDSDYYTISPALSYNLTPTIALKGSMDYSRYDYDEGSDSDLEQFRARIFLNFTWPRLWNGH